MKKIINERGIISVLDIVIYPFDFIVIIGDMEKEVNRIYKPREHGYNWIAGPNGDYDASTYFISDKKNNYKFLAVWFQDLKAVNSENVPHECNHAALELFKHIGATQIFDDQEPFCYLSGNLSKFTMDTYWAYKEYLDKNKPKKKKPTKKKETKKQDNETDKT